MHYSTHRTATQRVRCRVVCAIVVLGLLSLTLGALPSVHAEGVIYVRHDAQGSDDGTSWANAYTSLQSALGAASSGDQIWVAAGTYTPTTTTDRTASFILNTGVAVYGGFAGSETALSQRNWTANVVVLSGDLQGDDGANFANNAENSYHVVVGATGATLDGFTISGGNASGEGAEVGGGISNVAAYPTLANLIISGNHASNGGGMYNDQSNPTRSQSHSAIMPQVIAAAACITTRAAQH
jgi:hypothetical protein